LKFQVVDGLGLVALLCGQTIQKTAKPPHQSQIEQAPPASQGKLLCYPRECIAIPVHPPSRPRETTGRNRIQHHHAPENRFKV